MSYSYRYDYRPGVRQAVGGSGFDPASVLFAAGEQGYWLDPSDFSTMFQDAAGATPVTAVGQPVGRHLDKSIGTTTEVFSDANVTFTGTAGFSRRVSSGVYEYARTAAGSGSVVFGGLTTGQTYFVTLELSAYAGAVSGVTRQMADFRSAGNAQIIPASGEHTVSFFYLADGTTFRIGGPSPGSGVTISNVSILHVPGNHTTQSGTSFRPIFREAVGVGYADYDALDDRLQGTALCGSGDNSLAIKTTVPASLASTQVISGLSGSGSGRFFIAVNTSGFLCAGVGNNSTTTIVGSTDIRGETGVAMLVQEGSTITLYWNDVVQYTGALSGAPSTTQPYFYGCLNNNGTAGSFYGGDIYQVVSLQRAFTPGERAGLLTSWS